MKPMLKFAPIRLLMILGLVATAGCNWWGSVHVSSDDDDELRIRIVTGNDAAPFYSEPEYDGTYLGTLPTGGVFTVHEAVDRGGIGGRDVYYRITYLGQTGWVSEIDTDRYRPRSPSPEKLRQEDLPNWRRYEVFHQ